LRNETVGSSDTAAWHPFEAALALPLAPFVADVLRRARAYSVSTASREAPVPTIVTGTPSAPATKST
jgi:hypothetical protein